MPPWLPFDPTLLLIPVISGLIGYVTNWVGIKFLFYPVEFIGVRVPGLKRLALYLPDRVQQIPGILQGKVGWQGIVPSRASRMGSIAVDTGLGKIASQQEFYRRFDPDEIAQHIVANVDDEIDQVVDRVLRREYPDLWANMPSPMRDVVRRRVRSNLPDVVGNITQRIGENIDELLDLKMMVIRRMEANPELTNRLFVEVGDRELRFVVNSGLWIGGGIGFLVIPLFILVDAWWVLPVSGALLGYVTNLIALRLIFHPVEERRLGPFRIQGLFIKRQPEVAEEYAAVVARDVVTISNVAEELLTGPQSDRTWRMIEEAVRETIDDELGLMEPAARIAAGPDQFERVREALATETVEPALEQIQDPAFNRERAAVIEGLIAERLADLPPDEYAETLRAAFEEDEWMLVALGAALGFVAGWIQLVVVTAL